jgi:hypothetical protein
MGDSSNYWSWASNEITKRADEVKTKSEKYVKWVKNIDYSLTYSWFVLNKFKESKNIYFTWSTLVIENKSFTWEFLYVSGINISNEWWKYLYKKDLLPTIPVWIKSGSWSKNVNSKSTKSASWSENIIRSKIYDLKFIKWFTKMKLLWEEYDYNESNLKSGDSYTMNLFLSWDTAYVLNFENDKENQGRKEALNEYMKKVDQIRKDNKWDIFMINKLTRELNKAYNMQYNKLK